MNKIEEWVKNYKEFVSPESGAYPEFQRKKINTALRIIEHLMEAVEMSTYGIATNPHWTSHEFLISRVQEVAKIAQEAIAKCEKEIG